MDVSTYAWAVAGSAIVTVVGFAGCGSSVTVGGTTTNGSGGSPGHSGATVTVSSSNSSASSGSGGTRSATTTSATTTSTSSGSGGATGTTTTSTSSGSGGATSASSSSSGGGTSCDQACAHLATCPGGLTCSKLAIDCSTTSDCVASCIASTPCSQVEFGTPQACQAQCSGDGGPPPSDAGPPPMDAGPGADCNQCASYMCTFQEFACDGNTACQPWGLCALACIQGSQPSPGCLAACDAKYPAAEPTYDPLYTCMCTGCATACALIDPCAHGMDGGP